MTNKKNRGSIGITIVMVVFCLLMSVSTSYHKMIQTETLIQTNSDNSDKAMDAAFSGINYAMASIQAQKEMFYSNQNKMVTFVKPSSTKSGGASSDIIAKNSYWISIDKNNNFTNYIDENGQHPPYRFRIACTEKFYALATETIFIKSVGEFNKYDNDDLIDTFTAQIIAECSIDKQNKLIKLNRYKKMQVQNETDFFKFLGYDKEK